MRLLLLTICVLFGMNANAQETKTSIGFSLTPSFSSIRYIDDGTYPSGYLETINSDTKGSIGLSGNIFFQYDVSEKFLITWGLGIQNYRYQTSYYTQTEIEHPTISRETKYSQHYLEFNVSAKYRIYKTLYARAGVGVDLLIEQHAKRLEICPTCEYSYKGDDNSSNFNPAMVPVSLGVGYEMKLNDRLNLLAEMSGSMSVTNAFESTFFTDQVANIPDSAINPHVQQKPFQLGFSLGLIRSF